jgi:hypothetical protein
MHRTIAEDTLKSFGMSVNALARDVIFEVFEQPAERAEDLSPLGRTTTSSLVRVCCILASRFLVAPGNYKVEFRLLVLVPQRVVSSGFASSLLLMARFFGEQQILLPHAGSG